MRHIVGVIPLQNRLCRSSATLKGHGRFDHLIVMLLDKVPADGTGKYARQIRIVVGDAFVREIEPLILGVSQQSCHQGPFGLRSSRVSISSSKRPYGLTCSQISGVTARRSVAVNRLAAHARNLKSGFRPQIDE